MSETTCKESVENLNQLLADTITLRDLYKKHHWQTAGPTFYQLHLLFDKHYEEQNTLVDSIAERIQLLGGVSLAMAPDVAEITLIPRPPKGREAAPTQISRLLHAHEIVLKEARTMARLAAQGGDDGTNDLIVSDVIRDLAVAGHQAVVVCSAGFVADHLEILYDLDIEARAVAEGVGLAFARTEMPNDDPVFLAVLAQVIRDHLAVPVAPAPSDLP